MRRRPFFALALQSMARSRSVTVPYLLSLTGIVMMSFILAALSATASLDGVYGARSLRGTLRFGNVIMMIFAVIVAFYTHSFLVRRRRKEFALFSVLGMEKKHIARMMGIETLVSALPTTALGMALGALFSRLMYLILLRMLISGDTPGFHILPTPGGPQRCCLRPFTALPCCPLSGRSPWPSRWSAAQRPTGEKDPPARPWLAAAGWRAWGRATSSPRQTGSR